MYSGPGEVRPGRAGGDSLSQKGLGTCGFLPDLLGAGGRSACRAWRPSLTTHCPMGQGNSSSNTRRRPSQRSYPSSQPPAARPRDGLERGPQVWSNGGPAASWHWRQRHQPRPPFRSGSRGENAQAQRGRGKTGRGGGDTSTSPRPRATLTTQKPGDSHGMASFRR